MESQEETAGRIVPSEHMSEQEARDVRAAMERLGYTLQKVAEEFDVNYDNARKILARQVPCWPKYAGVFNQLLSDAGLDANGDTNGDTNR